MTVEYGKIQYGSCPKGQANRPVTGVFFWVLIRGSSHFGSILGGPDVWKLPKIPQHDIGIAGIKIGYSTWSQVIARLFLKDPVVSVQKDPVLGVLLWTRLFGDPWEKYVLFGLHGNRINAQKQTKQRRIQLTSLVLLVWELPKIRGLDINHPKVNIIIIIRTIKRDGAQIKKHQQLGEKHRNLTQQGLWGVRLRVGWKQFANHVLVPFKAFWFVREHASKWKTTTEGSTFTSDMC